MASSEIHSEPWLFWRILGLLLLLPVTLVLTLLGKRTGADLAAPFSLLIWFLTEAKVTFTIAALNVLAFIAMPWLPLDALVQQSGDLFIRPWTILSAMLLHGSLAHLFWNLIGLLAFGRIVEERFGAGKMLAIYLASGAISGISFSLLSSGAVVGASGAIYGLIAAAVLAAPLRFSFVSLVPLPVVAIGTFYVLADSIALLSGVADGTSYASHVGGFIGGSLLAWMLKPQEGSLALGAIGTLVIGALLIALGLV